VDFPLRAEFIIGGLLLFVCAVCLMLLVNGVGLFNPLISSSTRHVKKRGSSSLFFNQIAETGIGISHV